MALKPEPLNEAIQRLYEARRAKGEVMPEIQTDGPQGPPTRGPRVALGDEELPSGNSGQLPKDEPFGNPEELPKEERIREKPLEQTAYRISAKKRFPFHYHRSRESQVASLKHDWDTVNKIQKLRSAAIQRIDAEEWQVNGKVVNRYNMMKYIVEQVAEGKLLTYICSGVGGKPSLMTVVAWQQEHPDFKLALERAKEIQAQVFADEGLMGIRNAQQGEGNLAKVKHDALLKRAALQSEQFRDRAPIQQESDLSRQSEAELRKALGDLLTNNPNVLPQDIQKKLGLSSNVTLAPAEPDEAIIINPTHGEKEI